MAATKEIMMGFVPNIGAIQAAMRTGIWAPEHQAAWAREEPVYTPEQIEAARQGLGASLRIMQGLPPKPTLRQRLREIIRGS